MTALTDFYEPLRVVLGDRFGTATTDATLASALRITLNKGGVPGQSLYLDRFQITPGITAPSDYASLLFKSAFTIILPDAAACGYSTRAWSERFGDAGDLLAWIRQEIIEAEGDGAYFATWQDFGGFMRGFGSRQDFWESVVSTKVNAPFRAVEFSASGVVTATDQPVQPTNPTVTL